MSKLGLLVKSFPLPTALKFYTALACKELFNAKSHSFYSQYGEDVVIQNILGKVDGIYVDIGCNEPMKISNTLALYLKGWHGLNIDPNEKLIKKFNHYRKRDTSLVAAVSDTEQEVDFYEFDRSEVGTIEVANLEEWTQRWPLKSHRKITTQRLDTILHKNFAQYMNKIDLLTIDVEGHDFNVLKSFDLYIIRPKLIVIEIHKLNLLKAVENEIVQYMLAHHYEFLCYDKLNGYFIANDLP